MAVPVIRAGVIHNPKSRHNQGSEPARAPDAVLVEAPEGRRALDEALARFAAARLDLLVVDGGDGTVREVLTRAPAHFPEGLPPVAVLPSGKTNALAFDLGAPRRWPLSAALESARQGRFSARRPLEILRAGAETPLARGFIFGAGAFVRGTDLAQRTHRLGAFEGLAVGLTLGTAALQTLFGGPRSGWRAGEPMQLRFEDGSAVSGDIFLLLASTLERLPLGVQPFGRLARDGVRGLVVKAPPKRLLAAIPPLLGGADRAWLEEAGYHRQAFERLELDWETHFVLDGETFPGGPLTLRAGAPVEFVAP